MTDQPQSAAAVSTPAVARPAASREENLLDTETRTGPHVGFFGRVKRIFAFLGWMLTGFGLIGMFRKKSPHQAEEIIVYSVHRSFFLWGIILFGFISSFFAYHWPSTAVTWGWLYVLVLLYTVLTLLYDVSTVRGLIVGGVVLLLWMILLYLDTKFHMPLLSWTIGKFKGLTPRLDPGMARAISVFLLIPWLASMFHSFGYGRKTFSPNSIEEWFFGEGHEVTDRAGLRFRVRYRDLFESILGLGAGDIEAIDTNRHVVKKWENVLFLAFVWGRLDTILHQRAAVVDNSPEDPVEVEEVRRHRAAATPPGQ